VNIEVDFEDVQLHDDEEDGMLRGVVNFILYKGNHYHLTILTEGNERVFVDTNDIWDDGDRVGISFPSRSIKVIDN
jgi:spermidine/putrescine transport system ATP-binding protein